MVLVILVTAVLANVALRMLVQPSFGRTAETAAVEAVGSIP
jgi:hypothetical protein